MPGFVFQCDFDSILLLNAIIIIVAYIFFFFVFLLRPVLINLF